jgi:hypothetical protein
MGRSGEKECVQYCGSGGWRLDIEEGGEERIENGSCVVSETHY